MTRSKKKKGFEIFKLTNRLRQRLSPNHKDDPGFVDDKAIEKADKLIELLCERFSEDMGGDLSVLSEKWLEMRDMPNSPEREEKAQEVFTIAHEIKDISAQCGYSILAYFAENLRDYITHTDLSMEAQRVIIQACVDSITVVHKQGLKDDGGPLADELKAALKKAIEKFS